MTTAYWCVLITIVLPYVWTLVAKAGPNYDNRAPRAQLAQLIGYRKRADWAQMNAFEAIAPFAAGVIIAQVNGVAQGTIDTLAISFVLFRVLHGICYLMDWAALRSLVWAVGFASVIALFLAAAKIIT